MARASCRNLLDPARFSGTSSLPGQAPVAGALGCGGLPVFGADPDGEYVVDVLVVGEPWLHDLRVAELLVADDFDQGLGEIEVDVRVESQQTCRSGGTAVSRVASKATCQGPDGACPRSQRFMACR